MLKNVSLAKYSTMRLGGKARYLCHITDKHELVNALDWAKEHDQEVIVIGGGSNIIWGDDGFDGLVIVNEVQGFRIHEEGAKSYVTVGAGENWDKVVDRTVMQGLSGIEALSLIPGTAGATPVQNVGAYGQEIADTLVSIEAYDLQTGSFVTLQKEDCLFGYRTSRFKTSDRGRFAIISITLQLARINPRPPYYPAVAKYLRNHDIRVVTPRVIRQAVIDIRASKLPDPSKIANNGSFFANPIVDSKTADKLLDLYPAMPHWQAKKGLVKLSAAWLIEQVGLKGYADNTTGMAVWHKQPLVLINTSARTTADLITFRNMITKKVRNKFGIALEQEPELIGKTKLKVSVD